MARNKEKKGKTKLFNFIPKEYVALVFQCKNCRRVIEEPLPSSGIEASSLFILQCCDCGKETMEFKGIFANNLDSILAEEEE